MPALRAARMAFATGAGSSGCGTGAVRTPWTAACHSSGVTRHFVALLRRNCSARPRRPARASAFARRRSRWDASSAPIGFSSQTPRSTARGGCSPAACWRQLDQQLFGLDFQVNFIEHHVQTKRSVGAQVGFLIKPPLSDEFRDRAVSTHSAKRQRDERTAKFTQRVCSVNDQYQLVILERRLLDHAVVQPCLAQTNDRWRKQRCNDIEVPCVDFAAAFGFAHCPPYPARMRLRALEQFTSEEDHSRNYGHKGVTHPAGGGSGRR